MEMGTFMSIMIMITLLWAVKCVVEILLEDKFKSLIGLSVLVAFWIIYFVVTSVAKFFA